MSSLFRTQSIATIFRQISQKRKNGVIELIGSGEPVTVGFNQGKIVSAYQGAISFEGAIIGLLKDEGSLPPDLDTSEVKNLENVAEKLEVNCGEKSRDILRAAAKKIILDTLFRVKLEGPGHYSFRVQGVEYDASFVHPFTVGQVLLDSASHDQADEKFNSIYKPHDRVRSKTLQAEGASEAENNLLKICSSTQDVDALTNKLLLHTLEIKEGLVSLSEKGLVEINPEEKVETVTPIQVKSEAPTTESQKPEKKRLKARNPFSTLKIKLPKFSSNVSTKEVREEIPSVGIDLLTIGSFAFLVLGIFLPVFLWFKVLSSF